MKRISKMIKALLRGGLTIFLVFGFIGHAGAKDLKKGDILIADVDKGAIIRVDPVTGAGTNIALGGSLVGPTGLALDSKGDILVADLGAGAVIRVDPKTGAQSIVSPVSPGGFFVLPSDLTVEASGQILVVDADAFGGSGGIIRVDPVTGAQTRISSGGNFVGPLRVVVDSAGQIFVSDQSAFRTSTTIGAIFQVDPVTGVQTVIYNSSGGGFVQGQKGLALDEAGQIWVAFRSHPDIETPDGVASIEPVINGAVTVVSDNFDEIFAGPVGIAVVGKVPKKP